MTALLCVMKQNRRQVMMICKNFLYLLISLVIFVFPVYAVEKGSVKYEDNLMDYSVLDDKKILEEADLFFEQYEQTGEKKYLNTAMGKYYIITKIHPLEIYPMVQLARTYDEKHLDKFAKQYFNICYDINKKDAYLNYYFGDFYYKRNDFKRALRYFKVAYSNGYDGYYDLNLKIATIYEKFADLLRAKYYYEKAYSLNQQNTNLRDKALQIESLNYNNSGYYNNFIRK